MLLCSMLSLSAQTLQPPLFEPPVASDRPTQRWLPLPQGESTTLNARARLLQELQELMSNENSDSKSPPLSESQLQQMEKSLNELQKQFGSDKLPNLEDIPPEWINEALGDPLVRKQAQQLLEKYARDRQLPNPGRSNQSRSSDAVPLPRREPSSTKRPPARSSANPTRDSASQDSAERDEQLQAPENSQREAGDANSTLLPKQPDGERIDALKQLFEKLKKIEGDQKGDAVMRTGPQSSGTKDRRPGNSNSTDDARKLPQALPVNPSNSNSANNSPRPGTSNSQLNAPKSRLPSSETNRPSDARSSRQPTSPELPNSAEMEDEPSSLKSTESPDLKQTGEELAESVLQERIPDLSTPTAETRNDKAIRNSTPQQKPNTSNARQPRSSKTNDRSTPPNSASTKPNEANSTAASQPTQVESEMDLKTQLERQGLGSALKSIVKKTLQEQNELNSKSKTNTQPSATTSQRAASEKSSTASAPTSKTKPSGNAAANPTAPPTESVASKTPPPKTTPSSTPRGADPKVPSVQPPSNSSSSMSGLRDLAAEVWGAIRSTPGEKTSSPAGNSTPNPDSDLSTNLGFSWQGATWVLFFLALIALAAFFLLARKRIVLAVAAREAEARVAKELLADGIRTRADVVRAFHRFVLRRTQPVATWWNHRYVATRLTENSPQLSQVISDLASVYEQARYLPPHVELTSEEFNRVQSALSQCAAAGA